MACRRDASWGRRRARARSILALSATLLLFGCDDDTPSSPTDNVVVSSPTDLFVEFASSDSVRLWWTHDGEGETGFQIHRWSGDSETPTDADLVAAGATTFLGRGLEGSRPVTFRVRAVYENELSEYSNAVFLDLLLGTPRSFQVTPSADAITLAWDPPSGDGFDGFTIHRITDYSGGWRLEGTTEIDRVESQRIEMGDASFPRGNAARDHLAYLLATRNDTINSTPVRSPDLFWLLPRTPDLLLGPLRAHDSAQFVYFPEIRRALVVTHTPESTRLQVLSYGDSAPSWRNLLGVEGPAWEMGATMPDPEHVVAARRVGETVTLATYRVPNIVPIWEAEISSAIPGVWIAPEPGMVALAAAGNREIRVIDPMDGGPVHSLARDETPVSLAFPSVPESTLAVAERRMAEPEPQSRLALVRYPGGEPIWESSWRDGSALEGREGLLASASGAYLAMTLRRPTTASPNDETTHVYLTADGRHVGSVAGRAVAFVRDESMLIVLDEYPGDLVAYEILSDGGFGVAEPFARTDADGGIVVGDGSTFWTIHTDGWLRLWTLTRRWQELLKPGKAVESEKDVPRHEVPGLL